MTTRERIEWQYVLLILFAILAALRFGGWDAVIRLLGG